MKVEGQVRIPSGCAIAAVISKEGNRMSGEEITNAMKPMHDRSNGLGGGFAGYGIYPEFKDFYALHMFYDSRATRKECEVFLKERFEIVEQMGIRPESSHHEEGPGQNEIDFRYSDPLTAADNTMTFQTVVKTIARRNGVFVDFSPKPLDDKPGNGFHINMSVKPSDSSENLCYMIAGVLDKVVEMTAFLNPTEDSYKRFGMDKAPGYVSWSSENRSQLVRIPAAVGEYRRAELRSPDPMANPYLAFTLMIYAALNGLENKLDLPEAANINLYKADAETLARFKKLPESLSDACKVAAASEFIKKHIPTAILDIYCNK